jgi:F-type H+-transporting ATPase subunit b
MMLVVLAAAGAAPKSAGLPQFNPEFFSSQLFWLTVVFVALYFFLSGVALPRIGETIEAREHRIKADLDDAERLKGATEKALADYEKALADAKARAGSIAKDARDKSTAEVDRERAAIDAEMARKVADAERRVADGKARALSNVNAIAGDIAADIVAKLGGGVVVKDEIAKALAAAKK